MPNWCSTDYQIVGIRTEVQNLYNKFKKVIATDRSYEKDGTTFLPNSSWLGYVVKDILEIDPETEVIPCRGTIEWLQEELDIDEANDTASFQLMTETAWSDCRKLFFTLMEKYDVQIFFIAESLDAVFSKAMMKMDATSHPVTLWMTLMKVWSIIPPLKK